MDFGICTSVVWSVAYHSYFPIFKQRMCQTIHTVVTRLYFFINSLLCVLYFSVAVILLWDSYFAL